MLKIEVALLTLLVLLPLSAPASAAPASPVTLTGGMEQSVCREGQPAVLSLTLHNQSAEDLIIGGGAFEASSFALDVTDGAGHVVPRTANGERVLTPPTSVYANPTVGLAPGRTLSYRFNLTRLFDLSRAGGYTVTVSRWLRPQAWRRSPAEVPQSFTLTAGPLKFRMTEDAATRSGPVTFRAPPSRQTFLYIVGRYDDGIARYLVAENGSLSFSLGRPRFASSHVTKGADSLAATPDGRFLYASNSSDHTVSQFRVGNYGALFPLSPPTVPAHPFPGPLLMDPKGRFLYSLSGTVYAIGSDGRLTVTVSQGNIPPGRGGPFKSDRLENEGVVAGYSGVINPSGTLLYTSGRLLRLAPDGISTAPPMPDSRRSEVTAGNENAVALSPSGEFAFLGVSTDLSNAFFDKVVPMRVGEDGVMTPIPGAAQTPPAPPLPWPGYNRFGPHTLAVDPSGRFLIVLHQNYFDCYRIGPDGHLTFLSLTARNGYLTCVFFIPGNPLAYFYNQNPSSVLASRLNESRGLVPSEAGTASDVPFDASLASAVARTPLTWGPASGGLSLSARLPADVLPTDAAIVLTVILKNVTKRPISLGTAGTDMASFRLSLVGPQRQSPGVLRGDGEPLAETVPLLAAGHDLLEKPNLSSVPLVLPPGGKRQYRFVLSRLADLTVAGHYTIQITRTLPGGVSAASPAVPFLLSGPSDGIVYSPQFSVQIL